jgi:hypothetical protein
VGSGLNPSGFNEAWLARIPLPDEYEALGTGTDQQAILLGGATAPGGLACTLGEVLSTGALLAEYDPVTAEEVSDRVLAGEFGALDFGLPGDTLQLWTIDFTGSFQGMATLVFRYDPALLLPGYGDDGAGESALGIFHFEGDSWRLLPGTVDVLGNTITVQTASLSPFVLGVVPEPSSALRMAAAALALALAARRR